ncbi:sialate O-acetylesterase, partial [Carboxylicivirga linearis]
MNGMQMFFNMLGGGGGGSVTPTPPEEVDFLVFLSYGQSNDDGRAPFADRPAYVGSDGIVPGVKMWNGASFPDMQLGVNSGAEIPALDQWAFDLPLFYQISQYLNKNILVIKRSKGATSLAIGVTTQGCWNVDFANIPDGTPALLEEFEAKFNAAIAYIEGLGKTYRVVAAFRHQGEADAGSPYNAEFETNLTNEISYVRSFVGNANLPIFLGNISTSSSSYDSIVDAAINNVVAASSNNFLFDCDGKELLVDSLHFSANGNVSIASDILTLLINNV